MEYFSSNPSADTLNRLRGEVSEASILFIYCLPHNFLSFLLYNQMLILPTCIVQIHTVMVDNIEKILDRGERISLLVDKTSTMQDSAFHFRKQSRRLRRALWMKNAKLL
jgi:vesicle-associated membrane protein 7